MGDPNDPKWIEYMRKQDEKIRDRFVWEDKEAYTKEMNERKQRIVEEYGKEPNIKYFYYLLNAVEYTGEENLRKSFESIKGQGDCRLHRSTMSYYQIPIHLEWNSP